MCKCKSKAVVFGCSRWVFARATGTWARASRVVACVGVYEKPLFSAVVPRVGATDIPQAGVSLGEHTPVGYSFASTTDESDETNGFLSLYIHGALLI